MSEKKASWDDIPSLEDLTIDWQYEPDNPQGKRAHTRMKSKALFSVLDVEKIPVKVITNNFEEKGYLVDLTAAGMAVTLDTRLEKERLLMVGFFLGRQKIVSKVIVKNVQETEGKFKTGMVFKDLAKESSDFITEIFAAGISYF